MSIALTVPLPSPQPASTAGTSDSVRRDGDGSPAGTPDFDRVLASHSEPEQSPRSMSGRGDAAAQPDDDTPGLPQAPDQAGRPGPASRSGRVGAVDEQASQAGDGQPAPAADPATQSLAEMTNAVSAGTPTGSGPVAAELPAPVPAISGRPVDAALAGGTLPAGGGHATATPTGPEAVGTGVQPGTQPVQIAATPTASPPGNGTTTAAVGPTGPGLAPAPAPGSPEPGTAAAAGSTATGKAAADGGPQTGQGGPAVGQADPASPTLPGGQATSATPIAATTNAAATTGSSPAPTPTPGGQPAAGTTAADAPAANGGPQPGQNGPPGGQADPASPALPGGPATSPTPIPATTSATAATGPATGSGTAPSQAPGIPAATGTTAADTGAAGSGSLPGQNGPWLSPAEAAAQGLAGDAATGLTAAPTTDATATGADTTQSPLAMPLLSAPSPVSPGATVSAAPAAGQQAPPTPVHQQVLTAVSPLLRSADGSYGVQIQLHPQDLGAVQVNVHVRHGEVSIQLHATNEAAREALRGGLSDLRNELEDQGLRAGSMEVGSGDANAQRRESSWSRSQRHEVPGRDLNQPDQPPVTAAAASSTVLDLRM
jgi:flagellar hook-length control protein FliK